jgi:antitoxin component YwqK of YwqJK toxin-antitoxin module
MNWKLLILISSVTLLSSSCDSINNDSVSHIKNSFSKAVPEKEILKSKLIYHREISVWKYRDSLFSGYATTESANGKLLEKFGVLNGKKHGEFLNWHLNGRARSKATYINGKLNGPKIIWSNDTAHTLLAQLNYSSGKVHGEQKKWYPTGEIFTILHLNMGKEEGMQQAFRKNGVLYANYEAKNGRIFGIKKAALCFGLQEQKIKHDD